MGGLLKEVSTRQDLTALASSRRVGEDCGAKIATIFQDPMTSLDPNVMANRSQITEVISKHQGNSQEAKEMAIDHMKKSNSRS